MATGVVPVPVFVVVMFTAALSGAVQVFLLSRIREEYLATGDSHQSVVTGLSNTAR